MRILWAWMQNSPGHLHLGPSLSRGCGVGTEGSKPPSHGPSVQTAKCTSAIQPLWSQRTQEVATLATRSFANLPFRELAARQVLRCHQPQAGLCQGHLPGPKPRPSAHDRQESRARLAGDQEEGKTPADLAQAAVCPLQTHRQPDVLICGLMALKLSREPGCQELHLQSPSPDVPPDAAGPGVNLQSSRSFWLPSGQRLEDGGSF